MNKVVLGAVLIVSVHRSTHYRYLKGGNFRGKKILRVLRSLAKFAKIDSFFDPRKCQFAKINSRKIFQKLMKCEYKTFCLIQCPLN